MKITREQLRQWGACYDDKRISELVPKSGLTPLEIAALENVPVEDRMWVLLRKDVIPARDLRLLACDWAEAACRKSGWDDPRSLAAIAVARRYAIGGASEAELVEAASAALSSARAARAELSAWAAWETAAVVEWAAWEMARETARAAVRAAAWGTTRSAELAWAAAAAQLADAVRVLKRVNKAEKAGKEAK